MSSSVIDIPWIWRHVTQTVLVKRGQGALHTITLNYIGQGSVITLYDGVNAGGAVIGIIATDLSQPVTLVYDLKYRTGIYIAIAGEGEVDLTVNWI